MYLVFISNDADRKAGYIKIEKFSNLQYQLQQSGLLEKSLFFPADGLKEARLMSNFANALLENGVLPQ